MNATQRRSHLPRARMAALIGLVAVLGAGGWWLYRWLTAEDSTPGIIVASGRPGAHFLGCGRAGS